MVAVRYARRQGEREGEGEGEQAISKLTALFTGRLNLPRTIERELKDRVCEIWCSQSSRVDLIKTTRTACV